MVLDRWEIAAGEIILKDTVLSDWREVESLADSAEEAVYTTSFNFDRQDGEYVIDLGNVYYTAEVTVNGKIAGSRCFGPYRFDVTDMLQSGNNIVTIKVKVSELLLSAKTF